MRTIVAARYGAPELGMPKTSVVHPELLADATPGPQLDPLAVLRREQHFLAQPLFLPLGAREMEPSSRHEVAVDPLAKHDLLQQLAVAQRDTQDKRRLAFALGVQNFERKRRITAAEEGQSLPGQPFVHADGVLRDELEVATIATARLTGRIALVEHDDARPPPRCVREVVRRRRTCETRADYDDVCRCRLLRLRPIAGERLARAKPERLVVHRYRD